MNKIKKQFTRTKKQFIKSILGIIKLFFTAAANEQLLKDFILKEAQKQGFVGHEIPFQNHWIWICPNWKNYYAGNYKRIDKLFESLLKNLDETSIKLAKSFFRRNVFIDRARLTGNLTKEDINCISKDKHYLSFQQLFYTDIELLEQEKLKNFNEEETLNYYKHGLMYVEKETANYLIGKDFIDGGAYLGDTALVFKNICSGKIYSFEPNELNYNNLLKTIKEHSLENTVIPVKKGLGSKEETLSFYGGDMTFSAKEIANDKSFKHIIEVQTLDKFVKDNNVNPGLVKLDVEGLEYEVIEGALETIKKYKPILLISIYHTAKDFFEIKPMLENIVNYNFLIRAIQPNSLNTELMLIGYPQDL